MIKSRRLRAAGHVVRMEEGMSVFKMLTGNSTGKRPLGKNRCRWEDNTRMIIKEICINAMSWVDSALDRDYWRTVMNALNLRIP